MIRPPPFFRRGPGPLVSVLIPTRDRPDCQLVEVVESCIDLALDKDLVEVLIKVDDDDLVSEARIAALRTRYPGVRGVTMPQGRGYLDIARYLNELAERATGDWLFVLGDNTKVRTERWDVALNFSMPLHPWLGMQDVCMLKPSMEGFPFIRRRAVEILGSVTQTMSWDFWFLAVFGGIQCSYGIPIHLEHKMSSPLPAEEQNRRLSAETVGMSTATRRLMHNHAGRLLFHLECVESDAIWTPEPTVTGWYVWQRPDGARTIAYADCPTGELILSTGFRFEKGGLWTLI